MVSGKPMKIEAGPNWDDDLSGSNIYAANDPGVVELSEEEQQQLFAIEKMVMFYLPRICNHCLNAGCVAGCPSGAIYKRGEDGIVLINQDKCRGWRMCVSACPYKKTYYGWTSGKSENAFSATRVRKPAKHRPVSIPVSVVSAIWGPALRCRPDRRNG